MPLFYHPMNTFSIRIFIFNILVKQPSSITVYFIFLLDILERIIVRELTCLRYELVDEFRLNWIITIILNIIAGVIFIIGFYGFFYLYLQYSNDAFGEKLFANSDLWILYAAVLLQVVLHEYSHGIGYRLNGGQVKYGIKWLCPYCMEKSGLYYSTKSFILTLVLPLITGAIAGLLVVFLFPQFLYYVVICMLTNISGAAGDVMMLIFVIQKTKNGEFIKDELYGFSVHRMIALE